MATLPREKWGLTEIADRWSAGQGLRQQIFGAATEMMLELASVQPGSRVLDVAAGTGEQTLMAACLVGPSGYVLAADISASMLDVAGKAARSEGLTNVETRVMNAENLALDADSFDAVISRIALMLFPNPAKALTEMRRVVKPGGKVAALVFSTAEKNPYQGIILGVARRFGSTPLPLFALGEADVLEHTFRDSGFLNGTVREVNIPLHFSSAAEMIRRLKESAFLRQPIEKLTEAEREQAWAEIERQLSQFEGPNGVEVTGEVLIGVGTK